MRPPRTIIALILVLAAGCRRPATPARRHITPESPPVASPAITACDVPVASASPAAQQGGALVRSGDGALLAAVDEDADAVAILERIDGAPRVRRHVAVGHRPAQALFASGALWVLQRGDGTLSAPDALVVAADGEVIVHSQVDHAVEYGPPDARVRVVFGDERLDPRVSRGRRLFLASSTRMSMSRMACGSCHPDGRDDGLAWDFDGRPLRTPTLAGRTRAPFGWRGRQATLAEAVRVAIDRLHGSGIGVADAEALAAYVERGLPTPRASDTPLSSQTQRGRRLFRERAACGGCHREGQDLVDGARHALGEASAAFDTLSLAGVAAGGPWFHDGRYATLDALLADPRSGMGDAHALTAGERADLLAWLETL